MPRFRKLGLVVLPMLLGHNDDDYDDDDDDDDDDGNDDNDEDDDDDDAGDDDDTDDDDDDDDDVAMTGFSKLEHGDDGDEADDDLGQMRRSCSFCRHVRESSAGGMFWRLAFAASGMAFSRGETVLSLDSFRLRRHRELPELRHLPRPPKPDDPDFAQKMAAHEQRKKFSEAWRECGLVKKDFNAVVAAVSSLLGEDLFNYLRTRQEDLQLR